MFYFFSELTEVEGRHDVKLNYEFKVYFLLRELRGLQGRVIRMKEVLVITLQLPGVFSVESNVETCITQPGITSLPSNDNNNTLYYNSPWK